MSSKQQLADEKVRKLISNYQDPTHNLFLTASTGRILDQLNNTVNVDGITRNDIENFRNYLSQISREQQQKILRGKKREHSFRQVKNLN